MPENGSSEHPVVSDRSKRDEIWQRHNGYAPGLLDEAVLLSAEVERLREALRYIAEKCGDDSAPEDNAVQIARDALALDDRQAR